MIVFNNDRRPWKILTALRGITRWLWLSLSQLLTAHDGSASCVCVQSSIMQHCLLRHMQVYESYQSNYNRPFNNETQTCSSEQERVKSIQVKPEQLILLSITAAYKTWNWISLFICNDRPSFRNQSCYEEIHVQSNIFFYFLFLT